MRITRKQLGQIILAEVRQAVLQTRPTTAVHPAGGSQSRSVAAGIAQINDVMKSLEHLFDKVVMRAHDAGMPSLGDSITDIGDNVSSLRADLSELATDE